MSVVEEYARDWLWLGDRNVILMDFVAVFGNKRGQALRFSVLASAMEFLAVL